MRNTFFAIICLFTSLGVNAQDSLEVDLSADFVNQYVWRGMELGSVSVQPSLGVSYKGLSLTAWGSCGLSDTNDPKEIDLTVAYTISGFNIGVTDYWTNMGQDPRGRYFKYDAHGTNHVFEANVGYDFGVLSLQAYTNFAGDDGVNNDDERAYSTYLELAAPFRLVGVDWTATAGVVPFATTTYENTGFAVTNLSLMAEKSIEITDKFSIPVFAGLTANPCTQKGYFVFGFTLRP